ncbi:MAG: hypothetical protein RI991_1114 [Bacteroidota bacterium]|jgi:uncharacterized protein (DUF952 family)
MPIIYHITTDSTWNNAREIGVYTVPSLKEEGFIHCSQQNQLADVKQRYFEGRNDLLLLSIDTDKLTSPFIFEWSPSVQDTFPHVYGPINVDAVITVSPY